MMELLELFQVTAVQDPRLPTAQQDRHNDGIVHHHSGFHDKATAPNTGGEFPKS